MSPIHCAIDGIAYEMQEPFDFSFLRQYGRVFKVFDDQDSGNICFGVEGSQGKRFVKFAGARTKRGAVSPENAIAHLQASVALYDALRHENLIRLLEYGEMGGGYAAVFSWTDAQCMGRAYPEAHARFMAMPVKQKQKVYGDIQRFFAHVAEKGYVAVDFYDGSIMYDFETARTVICDIDFFCRRPRINDMGRMWGSSRFQAPEEYCLGAPIDEVTNVYTLGATAFALFGNYNRDRESWMLNEACYQVALQAVELDRERRFSTILSLMDAWQKAAAK